MRKEVETYLDTLHDHPNTQRTYRWALNYYSDATGDAPLGIESYKLFLQAIRNLSPSAKRICKSAVTNLYEFADALDPGMAKLNKHYIGKAKPLPLEFDLQAVEKVIDYCKALAGKLPDYRDRAFVLTLADSGMRISEICGLRRGDVDLNEQRAVIVGKGGKQAAVRFSNRAVAAIRDYLSVRAKLDGASGKPLASLPLFAAHDIRGKKQVKRVGVSGMRKAIKSRMDQAGVDPKTVRMHDFRHYFVTVTLLASGSIKTAQELARHSHISTTQRYAHLSEGELDRQYDEIFNR